MMLLVVDAVKGVQTQTAECLVVGEITTDRLVVVLNKTDLLPEATREAAIEKAAARIRKVLATTKFADAPIIPVAAAPGGKPPLDFEVVGIEQANQVISNAVDTGFVKFVKLAEGPKIDLQRLALNT
jgi:selenocysteine-specific elongation factor